MGVSPYEDGFMFTVIPILVSIGFVLVFGIIIVMIIAGIIQWAKNNNSPELTVAATLVTKRRSVSHHHHGDNMSMSHTSTSYYVTFEVASGDRMEFHLSGSEYGLLVEGDKGSLTFQGTRYKSFERERANG